MRISEHILLDDVTAPTTTEWLRLDWTAETGIQRAYFGSLTSGDSVQLQIATEDKSKVYTVNTHTTVNFGGNLQGQFPWIRVVKSGTAGPASFVFWG